MNIFILFCFCFFSQNFFERYRSLDENTAPPKTFGDCARVFTDCKDAEQFDGSDEQEQDEHKKHEEHVDEVEGAGDFQDENTTEFTTESNEDENKIVRRKRFNDFFQL